MLRDTPQPDDITRVDPEIGALRARVLAAVELDRRTFPGHIERYRRLRAMGGIPDETYFQALDLTLEGLS